MISVNIASHKARESCLKICLMSIIQQNTKPDVVNVYLNDYPIQGWMKVMRNANDCFNFVSAPDGDLGASAKFYFVDKQADGVYITLDDDLVAKKGYVGYMADAAYTYPQSIVGLHGTRYNKWPVKSYYTDPERVITYCYHQNEKDIAVDMLGSGCMAFRINMYNSPSLETFPEKNMTDPYVYSWLAVTSGSLVCLNRSSGFVKEISGSQETAIWHSVQKDDSKQTKVINLKRASRSLGVKINSSNLGGASIEWGHLKCIMSIIRHDTKVVEFGSGKSTRFLNYVSGNVTSFEHNREWAKGDILLRPIDPKTGWYTLNESDKITLSNCDVLIVDGPIGSAGHRYNIPLDLLPENAIIFVDDCHRSKDKAQAEDIGKHLNKPISFVNSGEKVMAIIR